MYTCSLHFLRIYKFSVCYYLILHKWFLLCGRWTGYMRIGNESLILATQSASMLHFRPWDALVYCHHELALLPMIELQLTMQMWH